MNQFAVSLSPPNEFGTRAAVISIDGRSLLDVVRDLEIPIATANGEAELAGTYSYLNSHSVMPPSRHLFGEAASSLLSYAGKVSVLECQCGCEGCWPLLIRITIAEDTVRWSEPQQPHRDQWVYPHDWQLTFEQRQYEAALEAPNDLSGDSRLKSPRNTGPTAHEAHR